MSQVRKELVAMIDRALGDDPKAALIAARNLVEETDWLAKRAVAIARLEGYDWGRIGRLLGITRQGARKEVPARSAGATASCREEQPISARATRGRTDGGALPQRHAGTPSGRRPGVLVGLTHCETSRGSLRPQHRGGTTKP